VYAPRVNIEALARKSDKLAAATRRCDLERDQDGDLNARLEATA
jgi:hypothetical protein